jgi:hypothetical protein
MRVSVACALVSLFAAACTPNIPVEPSFDVSALRATAPIPPEFAEFNRYDWRVNPLLAEQMCATPYRTQAIRALAAVPGEILDEQAYCETYYPYYYLYGPRPQ